MIDMGALELNKQVSIITQQDRELIRAIENGLPLSRRPYAELASQLQTSEQHIIDRLQCLIDNGCIKRFGVVVRHRELGYTANGMVVWDVPDDKVGEYGRCIGRYACVTLSYRRPRKLPDWPYNLFTMVHGHDRDEVEQQVQQIADECGLHDVERCILFSTRRFKQRGANYSTRKDIGQQHKAELHLVTENRRDG
jgi:DNA-binding Lrp family transcriptional regulator